VFLDGKLVFEDVVYAKHEGSKVILRDILGETKEVENCSIIEVDVSSTKLILSRRKRN